VLTFSSETGKVPFIDVVLNLEIAVYCTLRLHTDYLITFCSRWNSKLFLSVAGIILDLVIEVLLEVAPLRLVISN
jgi:hypothetical protein